MIGGAVGLWFHNENLASIVAAVLCLAYTVLAQQTKFIVPSGSNLVHVLGLDDKQVVPVPR